MFAYLTAWPNPAHPAGPTIENLQVFWNRNESVPLAAICTFRTGVPATTVIEIDNGSQIFRAEPEAGFVINHSVPILGLRSNRENEINLTVEDAHGTRGATKTFSLIGPSRHRELPPIELSISRPNRMEPGVTFIPLYYWPGEQPARNFGLMIAVDAHGEIVWYFRASHGIAQMIRLRNGNFLYQSDRAGYMFEVDMLGNMLHRWHTTGIPKTPPKGSIPIGAETLHHDFTELPNGNLLLLSTEVRRFDSYFTDETDPEAPKGPANVIGDVIIEITKDGEIVREWKLFDILDTHRIGHGALQTGFYEATYKDLLDEPGMDWSHSNSVFYDARDDAMVVSALKQDAVFKIDMQSGSLKWVLSNHSGWSPRFRDYLLRPVNEGMKWPFHQHAASITPHGTLMLFDNGTYGAPAFESRRPTDELWSRAVEYRVDEEAMTVEEVWSYGGPGEDRFFSPYISAAGWLPETHNVLITDGGRLRDSAGRDSFNFAGAHHWARMLEVTHERPAEKVWEIVIDDPGAGWAVFRAQRMPLYPKQAARPGSE